MSETAAPPRNDLYETDFYAWTEEQAKAAEEGRWADLDGINVGDEIRSLGRGVRRELEERMEVLLSYLLKWRHLAEYRGLAWKENIDRQREELGRLCAESPSLAPHARASVALLYENSRRRLQYDTYYFPTDFPAACPFSIDQVLDPAFYPKDLDEPAAGLSPKARTVA